MNLPFVPIRKSGKLPYHTEEVKYELEYGSDILQIHADAIRPGQRVLLVDDLIATGGTIRASQNLIEKMGGTVSGVNAVILLKELCNTEILEEENLFYLVEYYSGAVLFPLIHLFLSFLLISLTKIYLLLGDKMQ